MLVVMEKMVRQGMLFHNCSFHSRHILQRNHKFSKLAFNRINL